MECLVIQAFINYSRPRFLHKDLWICNTEHLFSVIALILVALKMKTTFHRCMLKWISSKVLLREVSPLPYICNVNDGRQFRSSNSRYIQPSATRRYIFLLCVCLCWLLFTYWSAGIPILTFNQCYDFGIVEIMLTTNLATSIWTSGETSLNKTLVSSKKLLIIF